jgi:hypothetical protein
MGQPIHLARPTTEAAEMVPLYRLSWWYRESAELPRWSPITHSRPSGTVMSNVCVEGVFPGYR